MDIIDCNHSTITGPEQPALRRRLRAGLARWRRKATVMLRRGPVRPSPRAAASEKMGVILHSETAAQRVAGPSERHTSLDAQSILEGYRRGLLIQHHPERAGWVSPARREAIAPQEFRIGSPLRRLLRDRIFSASFDEDFAGVMSACDAAVPAEERLTPDLASAFLTLHRDGHAHSVEVLSPDGTLVGGLYGIAIGGVFFVEAKFEHARKASSVALAVLHHHLNHWGFVLRSARWSPPRGVHMVGREIFQMLLEAHARHEHRIGHWVIDPALDTYAWSVRPRVACRRPRDGSLPPISARAMGLAGHSQASGLAHPQTAAWHAEPGP